VAVLGGTVTVKGGQSQTEALDGDQAVDAPVRPGGLTMQVGQNGNGIVTHRTFLGSVTRVRVLLSGDVTVQIDRPSSEAAALTPGNVGLGGVAARAGDDRPASAGYPVT
jgi:hypothetical protein